MTQAPYSQNSLTNFLLRKNIVLVTRLALKYHFVVKNKYFSLILNKLKKLGTFTFCSAKYLLSLLNFASGNDFINILIEIYNDFGNL